MLYEGNETNDGSVCPMLWKPVHECNKCGEKTRGAAQEPLTVRT